jgi:CheY-like chemotaxis protein
MAAEDEGFSIAARTGAEIEAKLRRLAGGRDAVATRQPVSAQARPQGRCVYRIHDPPTAAGGKDRGISMGVSILVVDDEPDVEVLFRQRFRREARNGTYVMHFASSGEEALRQLGSGIEPELIVILSDINMPGMDGLTLLGEIKRRFPALPVMMVTAYGDDERRRRAGDLGACEFVTKPVDFDLLKEQLRQLSSAAD